MIKGFSRLVGAAIIWMLISPGASSAAQVPTPSVETLPQTTLALLRYNRDLCQRLADDVQRFWRQLPLTTEGASRSTTGGQRVRDFVLGELLGDLASARAAGDLVRTFLPATVGAADRETGAALERLFALQNRLCDTVAYPADDRSAFSHTVTDLMLGIDAEVTELGRLLVVPESELQSAIEPFLTPIQMAAVEAQGELIAYLDSLRPTPEPPDRREIVKAWHRRYSDVVAGTKRALGTFLVARRAGDAAGVRKACKALSQETAALFEHHANIFRGPEPALERPLRTAYRDLQRLATACNTGDFRRVDEHLASAQRRLAAAAGPLRVFGLQP